MYRFLIIALLFTFTSTTLQAQEWTTNFEKAKINAAEQNRNIILVFQGSDWCVPCIKLDREIFNSEEFKSYSKDHFIMVQADFPRKKKNQLVPELQEQNNKLAEKYNKNGFFPFVVVMDKNGTVLGETGYKKTTPSAYIKLLESFKS
ncbi:thioredoxin family protein [Aquimarina sp. AD10]|uniref:thioredoxin family protein n=1 Tax=Aquimarina sp. AD10 TaxID=1714849 RepID=UPI000E508AB4|nr:thioredoxin family protein [Aquimarina sp. AD10]AXT59869.1 thioredoxin family protein [Aquimarina sp. AD10]RKN00214.1 DUF255 domain-containing protein [Aquimarina sp. AD10]